MTNILQTHSGVWLTIILVAFVHAGANAEENEQHDGLRNPKLSIFQVVKFANSECNTGSTRNGTCFTRAECDNIGGSSSGSCADGFGVCCLVVLTTGQTSAVNNSYLTLASDVTSGGSYTYTVCPCSDDICRMKFDFIDFTLEGPISGAGTLTEAGATVEANLQQIGTCTSDTFQIISPAGRSSPLICGENTNQHMILDSCSGECHTVHLGLGATSTVTRQINIRVMQYRCGEESGGPPGCLQYYENTSGKIRSFNFPDASPGTTITYNYATHLVNQNYKICMRRGNGYEVICYVPCTNSAGSSDDDTAKTVISQPSFGLSGSADAISKSNIDTECSTDYLWIPLGLTSTQFTSIISHQDEVPEAETINQPTRYCGNYFNTSAAAYAVGVSVCSYNIPFEVGVSFNDDEFCTDAATSETCESVGVQKSVGGGGGILGFNLCYVQHIPPIG